MGDLRRAGAEREEARRAGARRGRAGRDQVGRVDAGRGQAWRTETAREHAWRADARRATAKNALVTTSASDDAAVAPIDAAEIERQGLLLREIRMRKERNKVRRKYFLMILVSFIFAIALIYRYSFVIEVNERIMSENATLTRLENDNMLLQKQIGAETDLEKIRLLAESKLDMQKPDRDQIVYIRVPRRDHAMVPAPTRASDGDMMNPFAYLLEQAKLIQKRLFLD
ncbi:MAG: cell division protein FtsL [Oscillospiraceae bacterium]|nr:cell division protein FtsL [Oscillospiraceae bacterium]